MPPPFLAAAILLLSSSVVQAQAPLPLVEQADLPALRVNCERLLTTLTKLGAPLPEDTRKALRDLLSSDKEEALAVRRIQELLDPHCLIGVSINPQSRVKAARGPAAAALVQGEGTVLLVKVHNDAGITAALELTSPHLRPEKGTPRETEWLEARVYAKPPMSDRLSGGRIEYLIFQFSSREAGKREAKLMFDAGQGTQDLGFRAEVPVLFTIRPKK